MGRRVSRGGMWAVCRMIVELGLMLTSHCVVEEQYKARSRRALNHMRCAKGTYRARYFQVLLTPLIQLKIPSLPYNEWYKTTRSLCKVRGVVWHFVGM